MILKKLIKTIFFFFNNNNYLVLLFIYQNIGCSFHRMVAAHQRNQKKYEGKNKSEMRRKKVPKGGETLGKTLSSAWVVNALIGDEEQKEKKEKK